MRVFKSRTSSLTRHRYTDIHRGCGGNFPAAYEDCVKPLRGFLAGDEAVSSIRPGVPAIHDMGLTDHERERATRLASLGYMALACDMFGERTITPATDAERRAAFEGISRSEPPPTRSRQSNGALCPTASRYTEDGRDWILPRRNGRAGIGVSALI